MVPFVLCKVEAGTPRLNIAGLDPLANSKSNKQHDNTTSKALANGFGHDRFDSIDFSKRCVQGGGTLDSGFDRNDHFQAILGGGGKVFVATRRRSVPA